MNSQIRIRDIRFFFVSTVQLQCIDFESAQKEKEGSEHAFYCKLETEEKRQLLEGITIQ